MKKLPLLFGLLINSSVFAATTPPDGYEIEYDQSEHEFRYTYNTPGEDTPQVRISAYHNTVDSEKDTFTLGIIFNEGEVSETCEVVNWTIDGQKYETNEPMRLDQDAYTFFFNNPSFDEMEHQFVNAGSIKYKVCGKEYRLSQQDLQGINYVWDQYLKLTD